MDAATLLATLDSSVIELELNHRTHPPLQKGAVIDDSMLGWDPTRHVAERKFRQEAPLPDEVETLLGFSLDGLLDAGFKVTAVEVQATLSGEFRTIVTFGLNRRHCQNGPLVCVWIRRTFAGVDAHMTTVRTLTSRAFRIGVWHPEIARPDVNIYVRTHQNQCPPVHEDAIREVGEPRHQDSDEIVKNLHPGTLRWFWQDLLRGGYVIAWVAVRKISEKFVTKVGLRHHTKADFKPQSPEMMAWLKTYAFGQGDRTVYTPDYLHVHRKDGGTLGVVVVNPKRVKGGSVSAVRERLNDTPHIRLDWTDPDHPVRLERVALLGDGTYRTEPIRGVPEANLIVARATARRGVTNVVGREMNAVLLDERLPLDGEDPDETWLDTVRDRVFTRVQDYLDREVGMTENDAAEQAFTLLEDANWQEAIARARRRQQTIALGG